MKFKIRLFFLKFLIVCFLFVNSCKISEQSVEQPPNVIFIMADDLGYGDLGCYGQTGFSTPNIDKLAEEGILFTQHYSGSTVCAPSRSSLLTGMHTGHTYIRGNKEVFPEGQHALPDSIFTIAELFKSRGYVTAIFGKWGLGFPGSEGDPLNQGFDFFTGYNCQRMGHNYFPEYLWYNHERREIKQNLGTNNKIYAPELIQKSIISFLKKTQNKPFFMYVPSIIPHAELAAPEKYMKKFKGKFGKENAYKGSEPSDKYYKIGGYGSQPEPKAAFAAMISLLDEQVGEIIKTLKELKLYDNTIIIFTSDNGPHLEGGADPEYFNSNGELRGFKRDLYEGGIRVPLIVHWPEKIEPGISDHISAFWDFLPTFAELIDSEAPETIDGISFCPTLFNNASMQKSHSSLYWEFYEGSGKQAVRMGKWKAVKLNVHNPSKQYIELYNLDEDISESNDIANSYKQVIIKLDSIMTKSHKFNGVFNFEYEKKSIDN